jgi:hypothetical protein
MRSSVLRRRWASNRAKTCILPDSSTQVPSPPVHEPDLAIFGRENCCQDTSVERVIHKKTTLNKCLPSREHPRREKAHAVLEP